MLDYFSIIHQYFPPNSPAYRIYLVHCTLVTNKALQIARKLKLSLQDQNFIEEAAMFHDIGIVRTQASQIGGTGNLPYICHGIAGGEILRAHGLPQHALVAERHVGVGLTKEYITAKQLPLPAQDFVPQTLPEKIITYADCFYSKHTDTLWIPDTAADIVAELEKFDPQDAKIFQIWQTEFEPKEGSHD